MSVTNLNTKHIHTQTHTHTHKHRCLLNVVCKRNGRKSEKMDNTHTHICILTYPEDSFQAHRLNA